MGPWPGERPEDPRYDPELLADGDRRNVVDAFRYWRREAIVEELDTRRHHFHVAIENFQHDANIGTVVRTANAFGARAVHIVGRKQWNRRGAMVTDRYQHVLHQPDFGALADYAEGERAGRGRGGQHAGVGADRDHLAAARAACCCSGRRVPGSPPPQRQGAELVVSIAQFGSTRSINAGVAAGIVMHAWVAQHADLNTAW